MEQADYFSGSPVYAVTKNIRVLGATSDDFWDGVFGIELMSNTNAIMYDLDDDKYLVCSDFAICFLGIEYTHPLAEPDKKELRNALSAALHCISQLLP